MLQTELQTATYMGGAIIICRQITANLARLSYMFDMQKTLLIYHKVSL